MVDSQRNQLKKLHHTKPPFSLADIKKSIPSHCFQLSLFRSFFFVFRDIAFLIIFFYVATKYFKNFPHPLIRYMAWLLYWICQGCVLTALWVIGHECGHRALSGYQLLDDTVGLIIHSVLLTPYFSQKITHRRHHSNTSCVEREEVLIPKFKSEIGLFDELLHHIPVLKIFAILIFLTIGWPLYLSVNFRGRKYNRFTSHFYPRSPFFSNGEQGQVIVSDAGILAVAYMLYCLAMARGIGWVVCVYGVPMLFMFMFFVVIVYLQHTHASVPHLDSSEWDWMRGSLATIDRDYGFLNKVFHNVTDTHVLHHLFPTIPHYHAMEATKAIKPLLGNYYHCDTTPIVKALWREMNECVYIAPSSDEINSKKSVFWYSNLMKHNLDNAQE